MSAKAYEEGYEARHTGDGQYNNPHNYNDNIPFSSAVNRDYVCWLNGWLAADAEVKKMLKVPAGKALFEYELLTNTGYKASGSYPAITIDQYTRILKILEE